MQVRIRTATQDFDNLILDCYVECFLAVHSSKTHCCQAFWKEFCGRKIVRFGGDIELHCDNSLHRYFIRAALIILSSFVCTHLDVHIFQCSQIFWHLVRACCFPNWLHEIIYEYCAVFRKSWHVTLHKFFLLGGDTGTDKFSSKFI